MNMISTACDLYREAIEKMREAERLFHLCGIEMCSYADSQVSSNYGCHVQIHKGIRKFEAITGIKGYFPKDFGGEEDKSRKKISYNGLEFLQVGDERTSTKARFTFR